MPFKSLKNHLSNLATSVVADKVSNFMSMGKQKDAGKVAAQLLKKGPFDIPASPSDRLRENPLSFSAVQYPLDLGSEELGHYIIFESGFLTYQPQQDSMFEVSQAAATADDIAMPKLNGKVPKGAIMNSAISIYMPPGVKVNYNQSYDNDIETGISGDAQAAIDNVKSAQGAGDKIMGALQAGSGSVLRQGGQFVGEVISLAGMGDPVRFSLKRFGVAINPRNEAFYNTPTQRTFAYTFDFWPRNEKEALAVENIITIFKYNSAPGLSGKTSGLFETPNYFKIRYMHKTGVNSHLHKIGACFCTDVSVDYSPDGQFTTFETGQPVHTRMTVSFLEDRIITKRDIEAGA